MPSFRSIFLLAATAFAAFTSASPVPEGGFVAVRDGQAQSLTVILGTATTQLQAVQAQVDTDVANANGQGIDADTAQTHLTAVNDILTQALTSVQGGTTPVDSGLLSGVATLLAGVVALVVRILQSLLGGGYTRGPGAVGGTLTQLLQVVINIVDGLLPVLRPTLATVIPLLNSLGLGPLLDLVL